jgi:hypothetical protein
MVCSWILSDIRFAPFNIETKYFEGERKETGTSSTHHTKSVNRDQESLLSTYIDVIWMHQNDY